MFWYSTASDQTLNIKYRHKIVQCDQYYRFPSVVVVVIIMVHYKLIYFSVYLKITSSFNSFEITKGSQLPGVEWHTLFHQMVVISCSCYTWYVYILVCFKVQCFTTDWQDMVWDILVSNTVSKCIFVNFFSFVIRTIILMNNCITDSLCYSLNSVIHEVIHSTKTVKSLTMIVFTHLSLSLFFYLCEVFIIVYGQ